MMGDIRDKVDESQCLVASCNALRLQVDYYSEVRHLGRVYTTKPHRKFAVAPGVMTFQLHALSC